MMAVLLLPGLLVAATAPLPHLFMDIGDLASSRGLLEPRSTRAEYTGYAQPPLGALKVRTSWCSNPYSFAPKGQLCATSLGALPSLDKTGFEVYVVRGPNPMTVDGAGVVDMLRYTTRDFKAWSDAEVVLTFETPSGRSMAPKGLDRRDDTGEYLLMVAVTNHTIHGVHLATCTGPGDDWMGCMLTAYSSKDSGRSWTLKLQPGHAAYYDHDTSNILFDDDHAQWVALQTTDQSHPSPMIDLDMCDNDGCLTRRVITSYSSANGTSWAGGRCDNPGGLCADGRHCDRDINGNPFCHTLHPDGPSATLVQPDGADPPELQFYRAKPFRVGASGRIAAHATTYAPSPVGANAAGSGDGVYHNQCQRAPHAGWCHSSLMNEHWWTLPRGARAADVPSWRRPASLRGVKAAPTDEVMYAQPVTFADQHLWVGQAGVIGLPLYRLVGMRARSNAVAETLPFAWPGALWLNVAAGWYGYRKEATSLAERQRGCNEGCAAYVMAELLDAATGHVLAGYERSRKVYHDVDSTHLKLEWPAAAPIARGAAVRLRLFFRDATIYAIGAA